MDQHILSIEMRAVTKAVDRYLGESMPLSAKETTGGNAHIIMFLARNRNREIYQHAIEQKFCMTRSTASPGAGAYGKERPDCPRIGERMMHDASVSS